MRALLLTASLGLLTCGGSPARPCTDGDCSAPVVGISSPGAMQMLEGRVTVSGTVSDLPGVAVSTELAVDGEVVASTMAVDSFELTFDTATLEEGVHALRVRATDEAGNEGSAELMVQTRRPQAPACGLDSWQLRLWRGRDTSVSPDVVRCEAGPIDYDWGVGGLDGVEPAENFSAAWRGRWSFDAGTYVFSARADDGVRLTVDGELLIDEWRAQPPTEFSVTRVMTAGEHDVLLEYFEETGIAVLRLRWVRAP